MNTVSKEIVVNTHKGKGQEVKFTASFSAPSTMQEVVSAVKGEDNVVKLVAATLAAKAFASATNKVRNYTLEGEADTEAARATCLKEAIEAAAEYVWSERGVGAKTQLDNARAIAARPDATLEELRAALGLS